MGEEEGVQDRIGTLSPIRKINLANKAAITKIKSTKFLFDIQQLVSENVTIHISTVRIKNEIVSSMKHYSKTIIPSKTNMLPQC